MQLIHVFFIIFFVAYTVNRQILVHFSSIFVVLKHRRNQQQNFFPKIVKINSIGGAIILFVDYLVHGRFSVCFFLKIFVILQHCLCQNFLLKIVLINSLGGTTIPYDAYTAF